MILEKYILLHYYIHMYGQKQNYVNGTIRNLTDLKMTKTIFDHRETPKLVKIK